VRFAGVVFVREARVVRLGIGIDPPTERQPLSLKAEWRTGSPRIFTFQTISLRKFTSYVALLGISNHKRIEPSMPVGRTVSVLRLTGLGVACPDVRQRRQ